MAHADLGVFGLEIRICAVGTRLALSVRMRTPVALTLAGLGLFSILSLHCGGRVDSSALPDCPTNLVGACPVEGTCKQTVTDCAGAHELSCQCDGSRWVCPQLGAPNCPNECANARQGGSCSTKNLQCDAATQPVCKGPMHYKDFCTCDGAHFVCSITDCTEPPPIPMCPPPSAVSNGGSCSVPEGSISCQGVEQCGNGTTAAIDCSCMSGRWFCEAFVDPCADSVDGGSAPDGK